MLCPKPLLQSHCSTIPKYCAKKKNCINSNQFPTVTIHSINSICAVCIQVFCLTTSMCELNTFWKANSLINCLLTKQKKTSTTKSPNCDISSGQDSVYSSVAKKILFQLC